MRWTGVAGRAVAGAVVAVVVGLLAAGCGGGGGSGAGVATAGPVSASGAVTGSAAGSGEAGDGAVGEVVYFSTGPRGARDGHRVLGGRDLALRYAAEFGAGDAGARAEVEAAVEGTDFRRQVLVGWTTTTGCSTATAAELVVAGGRLELRVGQPKPPPECVVADRLSVVFRVPRERVPAHPVFG